MHRLRRWVGHLALVLGLLAAASPAWAQRPTVPDEWRFGKRQDPAMLRFCVDQRDPDWTVAQAIGEAIAGALLLQPKVHRIEDALLFEQLDDLYIYFLKYCDIYLGFKLIPGTYPDWIALTRPYYRASYGVLVTDPSWTALADMPASRPIGSTVGTSADFGLLGYLQAVDPSRRWPRYPMSTNEAAIAALRSGAVGAALVWMPSIWGLRQADPSIAVLRQVDPRPLPPSTLGVGAAALAEESFVRSSVDSAIAALVADGTIKAILERAKFPAMAGE